MGGFAYFNVTPFFSSSKNAMCIVFHRDAAEFRLPAAPQRPLLWFTVVQVEPGITHMKQDFKGHARLKKQFYWRIYNIEKGESTYTSDNNPGFLMVDTPSPAELQQNSIDVELNKDLEKMIEDTEHISVQLTWMAYDMVALRTSPELDASMRGLEEAFHRCRAAVIGDQEPESDICPKPDVTTLTQM